MAIKKPQVSINEVMKHLDERFEETKKIENEIRSSTEYICWLRDVLEERRCVTDHDIQYVEDSLEKTTYENICKFSHFYSIIRDYWEKYKIPPTYIDHNIGCPVYRVFYEDFYFEICQVSCFGGYVLIREIYGKQQAINYENIMEDKGPKEYKEREELIKEFRNKIKYYRKKAKKLNIDVKYLKEIVEDEFEI